MSGAMRFIVAGFGGPGGCSQAATPPTREAVSRRVKKEGVIDGIVCGSQPDAADLQSGRFARVINVRPDDEEGNVTAELLRGTSTAYWSVPFTGDTLTREHIERIRAALETGSGNTLIHCNGGTRAAVAAAVITAERAGTGATGAINLIEGAGYSVKGRNYEAFIHAYFGN
jgi:uncharacterized protein (TIGR01244 family)